MSTRNTAPKSNLLPALLALIVACLAGAAILTLMTKSGAPEAASADQLRLLIERIPFEAQNALRGEVQDFDELGASMTSLKSLSASGASTRRDAGLDAAMSQFAAAASA